jgi:RNA polymerase sigma-70 factor (ECF subfamily)
LIDHSSDITLWNQFLQHDEQAFGALFSRHYEALIQFGSKICRDDFLLEDAIQELFAELWQQKKQQTVISVKAYLLKALKYKLLRKMQKQNKFVWQEDIHTYGFEWSYENSLILREETAEQKRLLESALAQLTDRQKEIIYLRFFQNMSYEEVSDILQINYQAARNLLYQSIKKLRQGFPMWITAPLLAGTFSPQIIKIIA